MLFGTMCMLLLRRLLRLLAKILLLPAAAEQPWCLGRQLGGAAMQS